LPSLRELRLRRSEDLRSGTVLCEAGLLCESLLCEADLLCESLLCGSRLLCEAGHLRDLLREALLPLPHSSDSWCVECDQRPVRLQEVQLLLVLRLAGPRGLRSLCRLRRCRPDCGSGCSEDGSPGSEGCSAALGSEG
jgi:hypothetical protein